MMENLLEELYRHDRSDIYPFHMPGHKRNLEQAFGQPGMCLTQPRQILAQAARLDITEIDDFDNLHAPEGILQEALERAARLYGADASFYSINGSTAGLLTAISAAVPAGGRLIMARNCHKAVYHGVYLRGLQPVYLYPAAEPESGIADAVTPQMVKEALEAYPDAGAVLITSPTYDGICADVEAIAGIVHEKDAVLIVDGAHGAHFGFHPDFPKGPVELGADLTVVSLHKTLPAMTQTALLHVKGTRVDKERLALFSGIYQTSSPSYFFMAGMDACLRRIAEKGADLWADFFAERARFLKKMEKLRFLQVLTAGKMHKICGVSMDPGKILIESCKTGLTGKQIYDILLERYHLQMEMAAGNYVTAIVTCCDKKEGWDRLAEALLEIDRSCRAESGYETDRIFKPDSGHAVPYPRLEAKVSLTEALDAKKELCPLQKAAGKLCGAFINLYPPGIPLAVPGERLSKEAVDLIVSYWQQKLPLQGVADGVITILAKK